MAGLGWARLGGHSGLGGCGELGTMEIWSSPAAYDELNGNAERGGGADPIARELEEGEGGPDGPAQGMGSGMRLQQCWAPPGAGPERSGPGSRWGRG